jgi:hypothetical protein
MISLVVNFSILQKRDLEKKNPQNKNFFLKNHKKLQEFPTI